MIKTAPSTSHLQSNRLYTLYTFAKAKVDSVNLSRHAAVVLPYPSRIDPETLGCRALAVVESVGYEDWSLREVAKELGVTPNALYRHVGCRSGLLIEIAAAAADALSVELVAASKGRRRGIPAVLRIARSYMRFGLERPDAYAAFMEAKPGFDHPKIGAWMAPWSLVRAPVAEVVPKAADAAAFALWALLHGRLGLATGAARAAEPEAGLEQAIRALLAGYEHLGRVRSPLPPGLANDG